METTTRYGTQYRFYRELRAYLQNRIPGAACMKYPTYAYWRKALSCVAGTIGCYILALQRITWYPVFYMVAMWFLLALIFNTAHDASHYTMFKKRWANNAWFFTVFVFAGAHAYAWRVRHAGAHHMYPNVEGEDADLDNVIFLRFTPHKKHRWFHRFQHWYAPLLYASYSFYWLWIKDFSYPFSAIARRDAKRNVARMLAEICMVKILFLFMHICIPVWAGVPAACVCTTFLVCQAVTSLLFAFTFLITHYSMNVHMVAPVNGAFNYSWEMHQVQVSVDFSTRSRVANWMFGGFNHHITHHLFPHINHIHYKRITPWVHEYLRVHKIPFKKCSYLKGVISHFKLLKRFSVA